MGMEPWLRQERVEEHGVALLHRAPTSCATPPVGKPRSSATEHVCRTRVPPPTPMSSLCFCIRGPSSSTSGQDGLRAAIEDGLASDADHDDVRHDLDLALAERAGLDVAVLQGLAHQRGADVGPPVAR